MKSTLRKIVFASVLKPTYDARMYHKLARSIADLPNLEIVLVGKATDYSPHITKPYCHKPIFNFERLSLLRLFTEIIFLIELIKIKPHVIVVCTYELLLASIIYKKIYSAEVIYDVQENYSLNIRTGILKPAWLKLLLSAYVRYKEKILSQMVDTFILAEECYKVELPFTLQNSIVIENKADPDLKLHTTDKSKNIYKMCITGTLGHTYGSIESLLLGIQLKEYIPNLEITIIGYSADPTYVKQIQQLIQPYDYISLVGGNTLIEHSQIIKTISESHFSIMLYNLNPSFINKTPTKFYECTVLNTKIICTKNPQWQKFMQKYDSGVCIDQDIDIIALHELILKLLESKSLIDDSLFFITESKKLKDIFSYRNM